MLGFGLGTLIHIKKREKRKKGVVEYGRNGILD
jgi:hypothetical protein